MRGYRPGRFCFNVKGGRCEACQGDGIIKIEMHFLPDVYVPCEVCKGTRYNRETLEVRYKGKNIAEVLDMTVDEALEFFANIPRIRAQAADARRRRPGLHPARPARDDALRRRGAARQARHRARASAPPASTLYILDEPTTGLHFDDIDKLLEVLHRLVDAGNTVVVIEHNLDVIKTADWIIDLGPEGGDDGGEVVAAGTPEEVAGLPERSHTGEYLGADTAAGAARAAPESRAGRPGGGARATRAGRAAGEPRRRPRRRRSGARRRGGAVLAGALAIAG